MSIIAVMIIGAGLDKTGLMSKVAATILKYGRPTEARIIPAISGTVGFISSFMQNVGAAALFLPVVSRISARTGLPMSRLLMPMGFCAILGGTITMVGSSPLILLNDLILTSNKALPPEQQMETWSLFSTTPIGMALLATGIIYFVLAGRFVLPAAPARPRHPGGHQRHGLFPGSMAWTTAARWWCRPGSPLIGQALDEVEPAPSCGSSPLRAAARTCASAPAAWPGTWASSHTVLGVLAAPLPPGAVRGTERLASCAINWRPFPKSLAATKAGIAEVVIPPGSELIGKSARDVWMRKTYGIAMVALHRAGKTLREGEGIRDLPLQAGDALVVHTTWEALAHLEKDRNFVVVTTEYPHEELRPHKVGRPWLFRHRPVHGAVHRCALSVALMTGAIGMVLSGVLRIEEAYQAVSWKSVFLLASLIPLGLAVETSGTAAWIAEQTLSLLGGVPTWVLQLAIAVLATFFTLVMSNVGATVLLVPLAVNIAIGAGANPAVFALTVALATSNSFFLPTHQVNALIMGPAGYRVPDFMRAGGIMTVLFLAVMMVMLIRASGRRWRG
jgi:di/tricarboxylate transporter